jgi:hypothetical protein
MRLLNIALYGLVALWVAYLLIGGLRTGKTSLGKYYQSDKTTQPGLYRFYMVVWALAFLGCLFVATGYALGLQP